MPQVMPFFRTAITTCIISVLFISGCDKATGTQEEDSNEVSNSIKPKAVISVQEKKANFFAYLYPMIKQVNNEVLSQREILLNMQVDLPNLSQKKIDILNVYTQTYRVKKELPTKQKIEILKRKINGVIAKVVD